MTRWPIERARAVADDLLAQLEPTCERIAIAGSIRRCAPSVKDVEIVAQPRLEHDLFGAVTSAPTAFDRALDELEREGRIERRYFAPRTTRWGERYKAAVDIASEIPIDLFVVRPPAQWGAILALRTGPHELSQQLVTTCRDRGLRCVDGRLVDANGRAIATPNERDFFDACGVQWLEPDQRRA